MNNNEKSKILIFLDGDTKKNAGPANVNKKIIENNQFIYTKKNNKIIRTIETIIKMIKSNLIIFSGIPKKSHVIISKIMRKRTIYLMHGFLKFDNEINNLNLNKNDISDESFLMNKVDLILCVSKRFSEWFIKQCPDYKNKTYYINCGVIDFNSDNSSYIKKNIITVAGGNRNIKKNKIICDVINNLNAEGFECKIKVFGDFLESNEDIKQNENVIIMGQKEQRIFYNELKESKLFVLNTMVESFGLSVIDALSCGCNVLVPYNAGITSIFDLKETDIIYNYNDLKEIKEKILYNLNHDNNSRIINSIDFERYSWKNVTKRLVKICEAIYYKKDYKKIK